MAGALVVALVLVGLGFFLGVAEPPPEYRLAWIAEKTSRAPGGVPMQVHGRIHEIARSGVGTLSIHAVGSRSADVASMKLGVMRDGVRESEQKLRNPAIDRRLNAVEEAVARAPVGESKFSLFAALQAAADESLRGDGRLEVWLSTTVLTGSTDPLNVSQLTVADPHAAAEELLAGSLGALDLSRVDLHMVLLTPVGEGQEPLNPASEEWRAKFLEDLVSGLGAQVRTPLLHGTSTEPAWDGSSEVPRIIPLPDPTPKLPADPPEPVPFPVVRIDTIAFFPNSAELRDPDAARAAIVGIVNAFAEGGRTGVIEVSGYCAAVGKREGARQLSHERAETIAALLEEVPSTAIKIQGFGYDKLADPKSPPISAAQRMVVVRLAPPN